MLIDGHLLVGTTLMTADELRAGLDQFDQAIALFPAQRNRPRTAKIRNDPRDLVLDDLRVHPVDARLPGSGGRARGRRAGARRGAGASVHLAHTRASMPVSCACGVTTPRSRSDLATGLRELADEHEFRIWTAAGGLPARCGPGPARALRRGPGQHPERHRPLRGAAVAAGLLAIPAVRRGAGPRPGRTAGRRARPLDAAIEILGRGTGASILPELHILKGDLLDAPGGGRWGRPVGGRGLVSAGVRSCRGARCADGTPPRGDPAGPTPAGRW